MNDTVSEFGHVHKIVNQGVLDDFIFIQHSEGICIVIGSSKFFRCDDMGGDIQAAFYADLKQIFGAAAIAEIGEKFILSDILEFVQFL